MRFAVDCIEQRALQVPEPGPRIMRYKLSDYEWTASKPLLPNKPPGVPRVSDRRVLNHGGTCRMSLFHTPLATVASSADGRRPSGRPAKRTAPN